MKITPNFSLEEFSNSSVAAKNGIDNAVPPLVEPAIVHLCRSLLEPLRELYGRPLRINSGYRCPALNKAVGGVSTSQHTKGEAADVACPDPKKLLDILLAANLPFDQAICYPTFLHISLKNGGVQRRQVILKGGAR